MLVAPLPAAPTSAHSAPLYTVGQLTLAAFLGTPLAGFWLASRNFRTLGDRRMELRCRGYAVALTVLNFALALAAPERLPSIVIWLPFVLTTKYAAEYWFKARLETQRQAGGPQRSWWATAGWGLLGSVIALAVFGLFAVTLAFLAPETFDAILSDEPG